MSSDRLSNVELLLMLSEDVRAQGDSIAEEIHRQGVTHAKRISELMSMLDKAKAMLGREAERFSPYLPPRPAPKFAEEPARKTAINESPLPQYLDNKKVRE